ncbi:MAG: hypothetical protein WAM78_21880 [Candidatus Sulfotelmatobacter sp.]
MLISRLLPVSLLVVISVATVAAQTPSAKIPTDVLPGNSEWLNSPATTLLPEPNPETGLNSANPLDRIHIEEYSPRSAQFSVPLFLLRNQDLQPLDDNSLCYTMRSYKVARDNPRSDSTHAVGSSTCQPAARFHTRSIELRTSQPLP